MLDLLNCVKLCTCWTCWASSLELWTCWASSPEFCVELCCVKFCVKLCGIMLNYALSFQNFMNHSQLSLFSAVTKAKAKGSKRSLASWAIATKSVPLNWPVKNVPSTEITGLQCLNAIMHCRKDQNARRNTRTSAPLMIRVLLGNEIGRASCRERVCQYV